MKSRIRTHLASLVFATAVITGPLFCFSPAAAATITWDVSHLTIGGNVVLSGTFTVDTASNGSLSAWDILADYNSDGAHFQNGQPPQTGGLAGSIDKGVLFNDGQGLA